MAYRLIWSPAARLDLRELRAYIAESNPSAAKRFAQGVFQAVERLTAFPESGRIVPEFGDTTIREVIRSPCRIVYRVKADQRLVEIVRVWHAARGIPDI
jgi:plasmid stabilization system protein ParE